MREETTEHGSMGAGGDGRKGELDFGFRIANCELNDDSNGCRKAREDGRGKKRDEGRAGPRDAKTPERGWV